MKCKGYHKDIKGQREKLHDEVETVTYSSYLGDRKMDVKQL